MKEMLPVIMDKSFNRLCIIDDYISFIWTSRYFNVGDFELCISASSLMMMYIQQDYYVYREDRDDVGIIEDIKISASEDGNQIIIITGRFLPSILGRRIIAEQTVFNNIDVAEAIYTLIDEAIVNPSIAKRRISNFEVDDTYSSGIEISQQITGKNLLEMVQSFCETYKIGFKTVLDADNNFVFSLYEGEDRTYEQSANPYVIFSDKFDNLLSSEYEENYSSLATNVLIAGEGEGNERKTLWVTKSNPSGLDRHEVYKDARNVSSNKGEISEADYYAQLRGQGLEGITEFTTAFVGEVDFGSVEFNVDVFLGDLCVIENSSWGIYIYGRLVEVIESIDESGQYSIMPTFS